MEVGQNPAIIKVFSLLKLPTNREIHCCKRIIALHDKSLKGKGECWCHFKGCNPTVWKEESLKSSML